MKFHGPRESVRWLKALWAHHRCSRMSRAQLESSRLRRFRRMVSWAQMHSPYYRDIIQEHGINPLTCVPTDFPVLTKQDVIAHFDDLVTDRRITSQRIADFLAHSTDPRELFEGRYHVLHTSGTSGTIGCFVFSHDAWVHGVSQVVRASPLRFRRRVAFIAATRGHFAGVSLMLAGNEGTNALFFDVRTFDVGQPMAQIIAALNEFQPHVLSGYATVLKMLGEAQRCGELRIRPMEIGSGGEPLLPDVKAFLEGVFHVPVKNGYASSEHLYMAMTLPGADGMHLMEDDLIFELTPDHTCVTNLFNDVMPLIRYRMDDVLVPETGGHSPYPYVRVKEIIGRQEDAIVFTNRYGREDFIHPIVIVELVVQGLNGWQIVIESQTSFRFRARLAPGLGPQERGSTLETIRRRLTDLLAEKDMSNVTFQVDEVDSLSLDPQTGKFRLVTRISQPAPAPLQTLSPA